MWVFHAALFSFLLVAAVCDLDGREIPLPLTVTGTIVGLIGAVLMPWPWPLTADQAFPKAGPGIQAALIWQHPDGGLKDGAYPWPVWGPLPAWLPPGKLAAGPGDGAWLACWSVR